MGIVATGEERLLLDATWSYQQAVHLSAGDPGAHLVATVIARRAASLALAARQTLERRLALMTGTPSESQDLLPWDEDDVLDAPLSDRALGARGLPNAAEEAAFLDRLVQLASAAADHSSKINVLQRLLRRTREPLIVFSEYRDVAIEVASRLENLGTVVVIHGGIPGHDRHDRIREFIDGRARILVSTDAAGEGLNLQGRARLLVNLELPWNPWRIEQRVGRIDRIGQQRKVHAIHLFYRGSFEEVVLASLDRRRRAAAEEIGRRAAGSDTPFAVVERRLRACAASRPPVSRPVYCDDPVKRGRESVVLLYVTSYLDATNRVVQRDCIGVRVELLDDRSLGLMLTRETINALDRSPSVRAVVDAAVQARLLVARTEAARTGAGIEQRVRDISSAFAHRSQPVFQGSLFDRRAEQAAHSRAEHQKTLSSHVARTADAARALRHLVATDSQLVAAWVAR